MKAAEKHNEQLQNIPEKASPKVEDTLAETEENFRPQITTFSDAEEEELLEDSPDLGNSGLSVPEEGRVTTIPTNSIDSIRDFQATGKLKRSSVNSKDSQETVKAKRKS